MKNYASQTATKLKELFGVRHIQNTETMEPADAIKFTVKRNVLLVWQ